MSIESNIEDLGLRIPSPPKPVANYLPAVRVGELVFTSGALPMKEGKLAYEGRLGEDFTVEQGQEAARLAALNALAVIQQELGSLDRVLRIVKLTGYVSSVPDFKQQPAVLNGASDLLMAIFGGAGRHARSAVGAAGLPLGAPVEIELIVQVRPES